MLAEKSADIITQGYDLEVIAKSMAGMEDALKQIENRVELYQVDNETLQATSKKDLKKQRADMNAALKLYDEQRKSLKRELEKPYDAATGTGKQLVAELKAQSERYKVQIDAIETREKTEKADKLQATYQAAYLPEFTEAVPFERILETQWLNASTKYEKAESEMLDKANGIAKDFENLNAANLKCPEQTRARFLQTLDLGDALRFDSEQAAAEERAKNLAELNLKVTPPEPEPEPEQVVWQQGSVKVEVVYPDEIQEQKTYKLVTNASKSQLIDAFKAAGIHGSIKEV